MHFNVESEYNEELGIKEYKKVVHLIQREKETDFVTIEYSNLELVSTDEHPFYSNKKWIDAKDLSAGNLLWSQDGSFFPITSVDNHSDKLMAYNFTVADNHNYYVGEKSVLVHNSKPCPIFNLPKRVKSPKGVKGGFTDPRFTYRIDTNNIGPVEKFHVHIYLKKKEVAKITAKGGWLPMHGGKPLSAKPSTVPAIVRKEINTLINYINKDF